MLGTVGIARWRATTDDDEHYVYAIATAPNAPVGDKADDQLAKLVVTLCETNVKLFPDESPKRTRKIRHVPMQEPRMGAIQ
jgi:hypothetical protein